MSDETKSVGDVNQTNVTNVTVVTGQRRNKWTALFLCLFFGALGIHRFYEGKVVTGLLYLCTLGLFGIGIFIDFLIILFKPNPYYV